MISITKFSSHFLTIFSELTLSRFLPKKPKIDNDQRANFYFLHSKYPAKIDTIHQKQRQSMHYNATKQAKSTPTTHQKSNKAHQIHTKTKPKATKWAGFALKNSHSHPTPTSYLIICFGITSVRTCALSP